MNKETVFDRHPKVTLMMTIGLLLFVLYGLSSIRLVNNAYTEYETKSIKTLLRQYYARKVIDNNVGRFIKLREHRPNVEKYERPSRNYMKNVAPGTIERKYYRLATDKDGFIEPSAFHVNPFYKVVFLGGSTTECLYMEEQERFPFLVGRLLEQRIGKTVNSYNGGVSANETQHDINILLNKVLPLKPQMVVLMENVNDLVVLRTQGSYWYPDSLKSHIQTGHNIFTRYELPPYENHLTDAQMLEEYRLNLETFIAICKIRHITPVLMTQANRVDDDPLYHQFNQTIRDIGQQHQVLVVDLASEIPATTANLYDHYHYTAAGSQLAANVIADKLYPVVSAT